MNIQDKVKKQQEEEEEEKNVNDEEEKSDLIGPMSVTPNTQPTKKIKKMKADKNILKLKKKLKPAHDRYKQRAKNKFEKMFG